MALLNSIKFILNHPLNRKRKLVAFCSYIKWQIKSTIFKGTHIHEWVNGIKFNVKKGETGLTGNIYVGLHEFNEMSFLLHYLSKGDCFCDIGANSGSYTLLASSIQGVNSISFEPSPETYERLIENINLNKLENRVLGVRKCIGDKEGSVYFSVTSDTMNHILIEGKNAEEKIEVPMTTLDSFTFKSIPSVIKIDVEGYETLVVQGGRNLLSNSKLSCVIMELNGSGKRYGFEDGAIVDEMHKLGFHMYDYSPFERKLYPIKSKKVFTGNTIFIKEIEKVQQKVLSGKNIYINDLSF